MVALIAALGEKQAVIVGHDWDAPVASRSDGFAAGAAGLAAEPHHRRRRSLGAAGACPTSSRRP
jgi:pimeloyl-ACP methyl ester carboxylesterase